jgi:RNA polymerase sigma factor (TIGR02999 family)
MPALSPQQVTQLLQAWSQGEESALQKLAPLVYEELHQLAHRYMRRERPGHILQTSALVNEAFLRLTDCRKGPWKNRDHFFALSARLMRQILVDFARSRGRQKRGGGAHPVSLDEAVVLTDERAPDLVALDEALNALAALDEQKSRVVELRFFGGLSVQETAEVLKISADKVMRDWSLSRSWLYREMSEARAGREHL